MCTSRRRRCELILGPVPDHILHDELPSYAIPSNCVRKHDAAQTPPPPTNTITPSLLYRPVHFSISKSLYLPRYDSPLRCALSNFSGLAARNELEPTSFLMAGDGLNMGSKTIRLRAPDDRISRPTMVRECPWCWKYIGALSVRWIFWSKSTKLSPLKYSPMLSSRLSCAERSLLREKALASQLRQDQHLGQE
jgi:hypothetical protein